MSRFPPSLLRNATNFEPFGAWTTDTHCLEIDVFAPPRSSLLKLAEAHAAESAAGAEDADANAEDANAEAAAAGED